MGGVAFGMGGMGLEVTTPCGMRKTGSVTRDGMTKGVGEGVGTGVGVAVGRGVGVDVSKNANGNGSITA